MCVCVCVFVCVCVCVCERLFIKILALHFAYSNNKGTGQYSRSFRQDISRTQNRVCFTATHLHKASSRYYLMHEAKFNK